MTYDVGLRTDRIKWSSVMRFPWGSLNILDIKHILFSSLSKNQPTSIFYFCFSQWRKKEIPSPFNLKTSFVLLQPHIVQTKYLSPSLFTTNSPYLHFATTQPWNIAFLSKKCWFVQCRLLLTLSNYFLDSLAYCNKDITSIVVCDLLVECMNVTTYLYQLRCIDGQEYI